jgi:hypothetical protein
VKTVRVFLGADMRGAHVGLAAQAARHQVSLSKLGPQEAVIFINRARDRLKSYSFNGVISYVHFTDKRAIDMAALNELPRAFNADGTLDYSKALRVALEKRLSLKQGEKVEVL